MRKGVGGRKVPGERDACVSESKGTHQQGEGGILLALALALGGVVAASLCPSSQGSSSQVLCRLDLSSAVTLPLGVQGKHSREGEGWGGWVEQAGGKGQLDDVVELGVARGAIVGWNAGVVEDR